MRALVIVLALTAACGDDFREFDASVQHDAGVFDEGVNLEGGVPVGAVFTVSGCLHLDFDASARPHCTATRERPLTFIPLSVNVASVLWTLPGGDPDSSTQLTPEARWSALGTYEVSLAAAGGGGTALGSGTVVVSPGGAGSTCNTNVDCDATSGLECLCGAGDACSAGLAGGLCARPCAATTCAAGEICADVGSAITSPQDGGVSNDGGTSTFAVCLPTCTTSTSCRTGFLCRNLPIVSVGSPYTWGKACFAADSGEVGAACRDDAGNLDSTLCLTGHCEGLGARGICTEVCDDDTSCPDTAACVSIPSVGKRCLARCTAVGDCDDVLMDCIGPGAGGLGYTLPSTETGSTTLCAPKRCTQASDCAPAGSCNAVGGAKFCVAL